MKTHALSLILCTCSMACVQEKVTKATATTPAPERSSTQAPDISGPRKLALPTPKVSEPRVSKPPVVAAPKARGKVRAMRSLMKVEGVLTRGEVYRGFALKVDETLACFDRELARKPKLAGKTTFYWEIQPDGRVERAREASSTLQNDTVSRCVLTLIRGMKFPSHAGENVKVHLPLVFQSRSLPSEAAPPQPPRVAGVQGRVRGVRASMKVVGELSHDDVHASFEPNMRAMLACYEETLSKRPRLAGEMVLAWEVRSDGSVRAVRDASKSVLHPEVSKCVLEVLMDAQFPKPLEGSVKVRYPLLFEPVTI